MRLLLLFSALLAALSGVAGARVVAQPIQASASAVVASSRAVAVVPVSLRFAAPPYPATPPLRLGVARLVSIGTARLLYAERRRE